MFGLLKKDKRGQIEANAQALAAGAVGLICLVAIGIVIIEQVLSVTSVNLALVNTAYKTFLPLLAFTGTAVATIILLRVVF